MIESDFYVYLYMAWLCDATFFCIVILLPNPSLCQIAYTTLECKLVSRNDNLSCPWDIFSETNSKLVAKDSKKQNMVRDSERWCAEQRSDKHHTPARQLCARTGGWQVLLVSCRAHKCQEPYSRLGSGYVGRGQKCIRFVCLIFILSCFDNVIFHSAAARTVSK